MSEIPHLPVHDHADNVGVVEPLDDISNAACEAVANNIKGTLAIPHA